VGLKKVLKQKLGFLTKQNKLNNNWRNNNLKKANSLQAEKLKKSSILKKNSKISF
jgi:hypothetical protein